MEQHPIPQQISSYEFRLVGDMTLKQFFQLAGGVLVALLFYASPLPWYLKWPAVFFFAFLGAAMAFLPFEERPLPTWIMAFLKAVYSPTQFIWQKRPQKPEIFAERPTKATTLPSPVAPADQKKLAGYLASLPLSKTPLDDKEEAILAQIQNLFLSTPLPPTRLEPAQPPLSEEKPPAREIQEAAAPKYTPSPLTYRAPTERKVVQQAPFAPKVPLPLIPEIPNVLVGIVLDKEGKIVEGAIMEIRDTQGNPVRALKTNKLGQFQIVTPLSNDTYELETEKEGIEFDIVKVELKGEIVQPIEIRARE